MGNDPRFGADSTAVLGDGPREIGFGLDRGVARPGRSRECPAQPPTLSIKVSAQPPCTPPIRLSECRPRSPPKAAKPSPSSVIQNDMVSDIGACGSSPSMIA